MLLVFCTADHGGLADYAHAQAKALAARGHSLMLLVPAGYPHHSSSYHRANLPTVRIPGSSRFRFLQRFNTALTILAQQLVLNRAIASSGCRRVLFTSYSEYLAPLWAWSLRQWRRRGVTFAAVVHDPVRDHVVGPRWWHDVSIAQGYSFLSLAFLHAPIRLDPVASQARLRIEIIPHGPYRFPSPQSSSDLLRSSLSIPTDSVLLLSFGHIRDNKNLDLVLKAMTELPQLWLLVAGPEATAGQVSSVDYRKLATHLCVANRCRWQIGYQSPEKVADYFNAADAVLLTYAASFHSASGVMHLAAHYRKPVLASAGASALVDTVRSFNLGVVVPPDDAEALQHGLQQLFSTPPSPQWQSYAKANSWDRNAQLVAQALGLEPQAFQQAR